MALWQIPIELKGISHANLASFQIEIEKILGGNNSALSSSLHFGRFDGNDISIYLLEDKSIQAQLRVVPDEDLIDELSSITELISRFNLTGWNEK